MTAEEINARLVKIERMLEQVNEEMDSKKFCYQCRYILIEKIERTEYGVKFDKSRLKCPAMFWPDEKSCRRRVEYELLNAIKRTLLELHKQLSDDLNAAEA